MWEKKSPNIFSASILVIIFRWRMEYKFYLPFFENKKLVCKEYIINIQEIQLVLAKGGFLP